MDLNMPFMDGNKATEQIKNFYSSQGLTQPLVAAITGHSEDVFKEQAKISGVDEFLTKPATL